MFIYSTKFNLMKQYIPNALTLLNLFCGSVAVIFAVNDNFVATALFVFLGVFFDFFDGFAARKLNIQSELGVQLDSLADMVTSGLVPGIIMYKLLNLSGFNLSCFTMGLTSEHVLSSSEISVLPLIGLFVTLASAYRLAKFNIDTEQQNFFKGLPTPANTLLIVSLPLILEFQNNNLINTIILNQWFLVALTAFSCWILNSDIKLFALKFKDWSFKNNAIRYIFIILCIVLLILLQFAAIPMVILLYIAMSVVDNISSK